MTLSAVGWPFVAFLLQLAGAIGCALAAAIILRRGDGARADRVPVVAALCFTSAWCVLVAAVGPFAVPSLFAETARNLAWIGVLFRLFAVDGRDRSLAPIRPVVIALAFVECLQPPLVILRSGFGDHAEAHILVGQVSSLFHLLVAIGALVLVHNLFAGARGQARRVLRWSAAALACLWGYDLNFYMAGYLSAPFAGDMAMLRGPIAGIASILLAVGANSTAESLRFRPSRAATFQTLSLLLIGAYLVTMVAIAQSMSLLGGEMGRLTQVGFVFAASVVALLWLPSERLRGWLRVTVLKNLFQHRYDYRAEWLRFTRTIGRGGDKSRTLSERVVQALADITDSPSGLLLAPGDDRTLELTARWQWPALEVPGDPIPQGVAIMLERDNFIFDLDDARAATRDEESAVAFPQWLLDEPDAWALVPLLHFDRLVGVVVLGRPAGGRRLDWEDFDLLRIAGQQLASYLAEQAVQQTLMEATRFDEFNRRIAFVMHDIKNLASQLSLLARNAERHADNAEFRKDMLVTLRSSADKLNGLLARLGRYGAQGPSRREVVQLSHVARRAVETFAPSQKVVLVREEECAVSVDPEALEQALVHLVQNAVDASEPGSPVCLDISCDGLHGRVDVIDSGTGMSPQFVRNGLFRPFVSKKDGGFGIGAYEARELVRAMGGRVDVESREGLGTRFSIRLPVAAAAELLAHPEIIRSGAA